MIPIPETLHVKVKMYIYEPARKGDWIINYGTCRKHIPELLKLAGIVDTETWHCPDKVNVDIREETLILSIDQSLQMRTEIALLRHDYLDVLMQYKDMADNWLSEITCPSSPSAFTEIKNGSIGSNRTFNDRFFCKRTGPNIPLPPVEVLLYYLIQPEFQIQSKMTWAN
jgi:hypothetical protein